MEKNNNKRIMRNLAAGLVMCGYIAIHLIVYFGLYGAVGMDALTLIGLVGALAAAVSLFINAAKPMEWLPLAGFGAFTLAQTADCVYILIKKAHFPYVVTNIVDWLASVTLLLVILGSLSPKYSKLIKNTFFVPALLVVITVFLRLFLLDPTPDFILWGLRAIVYLIVGYSALFIEKATQE
ncbi:MAG: hypothetical protein IJY50_06265 [Clostridia bacterium]|nr:hypothetical protein [Clostridia bacterium]